MWNFLQGEVCKNRGNEIYTEWEFLLLPSPDYQCGVGWGSCSSESEGIKDGMDTYGKELGTTLAMQRQPCRSAPIFRGHNQQRKNSHLLHCCSCKLEIWSDV